MQNNVDFGSKPKFLICFVCGREFSKGSLEIHFYQCVKKAEIENNRVIEVPNEYLIFFEKVKSNQKILYSEIEDFNEFSNLLFKSKTMAACPYCNRRFLKDRLEVHLRSCKPKNNQINNLVSGQNIRTSKMLDANIIKNLNNAKSVEKINANGMNISKSTNFNLKNIKIIQNANNDNNSIPYKGVSKFRNNEKYSLNSNEEICPNCNEKINIGKIPLHLKKCTGKGKRNSSQINFRQPSDTKYNLKSSLIGSNEKGIANDDINSNSNPQLKNRVFSTEKKPQFNKTLGEKIKPSFLVCYLCGREFGKTSLEIHLKSCTIKFLNSEDISNTTSSKNFKGNTKSNLPDPPEMLYELLDKINTNQNIALQEINEYNQIAEKIYNEKSLKPCKGCKRTFVKESLEVHLRSCKLAQKAMENEPTHMKITQRPRMLICPLCGREFGTMSLEIHIKSCKKKFDLEQENMPINLRRNAENILEKYYKNLENNKNDLSVNNKRDGNRNSKGAYNFDQLNDDAYEIFTKEALVPCDNCGRTFLPDRLLVHLRSCKTKKEKKV